MIIYRENIGKFISQCFNGSSVLDIGSVISKQMRLNGITYFGESQVNAWNASLPERGIPSPMKYRFRCGTNAKPFPAPPTVTLCRQESGR